MAGITHHATGIKPAKTVDFLVVAILLLFTVLMFLTYGMPSMHTMIR